MEWNGMEWNGMELNWIELNWFELIWIELNWMDWIWMDLNWTNTIIRQKHRNVPTGSASRGRRCFTMRSDVGFSRRVPPDIVFGVKVARNGVSLRANVWVPQAGSLGAPSVEPPRQVHHLTLLAWGAQSQVQFLYRSQIGWWRSRESVVSWSLTSRRHRSV